MKQFYNKIISCSGGVLLPGCSSAVLICISLYSFSQGDLWQQKQSLGLEASARSQALCFSIGGKGYVGSGMDVTLRNDFWEYDPLTNVWTQKANVPGGGYLSATGFNIGNKGYICAGKSFWEYDPAANVWISKADFSGVNGTAGFAIGTKGYVGNFAVGSDNFWEFDPATNAWTQKANFNGPARVGPSAFSINNKGYIGLGGAPSPQPMPPDFPYFPTAFFTDFWEYDPVIDTWEQKANFSGVPRWEAVGFSVGNKGFVGTGNGNSSKSLSDFWEYDPATDVWIQKANIPGAAREQAVGFGIGDKGYIGTGNRNNNEYDHGPVNDLWAYDTAFDSWVRKADFGGGPRMNAAGFSIADKGYVGTGFDGSPKKDFWEYDPATDQWHQKPDFPGGVRREAIGFGLGASGFLGTGWVIARFSFNNDLWQYDQASSAWVPGLGVPNSLPGRAGAFACTIGDKAYVGGGYYYATLINDLWEYDPVARSWTQKAAAPGGAFNISPQLNLGIGNKGYSLGASEFVYDTTTYEWVQKTVDWEYDPATNVWTKKTNPGIPGTACIFSTQTKGYAFVGLDLWEYDPVNDAWAQRAKFPGAVRSGATAFSIGGNGYFGFGRASDGLKNDFWEYIPPSPNSITTSVAPDTLCSGSTVTVSFTAIGAYDPGNIFTAQLSDSTGSFSLPEILGSDTSAISRTMNVRIPDNLSSGQAYRIRVVSSSPVITGSDNGVNLVIDPPPVARAKNLTVYLNEKGTARIKPEDIDSGSVVHCGPLTPSLADTIFNCKEIGLNKVALTVTDVNGRKATDTADVMVVDSLKPFLRDVFTIPKMLWPPDHKMRRVTVYYRAKDNCCIATKSISVTSNEPPPGNKTDWVILDDHHLLLRAEVNGGRHQERIYYISVTVRDSSGNSATEVASVVVSPHYRRDYRRLDDQLSEQEDSAAGLNEISGKTVTAANGLAVTAYPNPSRQSFTLVFQSNDDLPIFVRVADNLGRLTEIRANVTPNGTLDIGNAYRPGDYYVQAIQGEDRVTLHLLKLPN